MPAQITIINAPRGTQWTLYVEVGGRVADGTINEATYVIDIPEGASGEGKIKFTVPIRTRDYQNIFFSVPVFSNRSQTIDVEQQLPARGASTLLSDPPTPPKSVHTPKPKKEFLKNKLKEMVQENLDTQDTKPNNNEETQVKKNFWDSLK